MQTLENNWCSARLIKKFKITCRDLRSRQKVPPRPDRLFIGANGLAYHSSLTLLKKPFPISTTSNLFGSHIETRSKTPNRSLHRPGARPRNPSQSHEKLNCPNEEVFPKRGALTTSLFTMFLWHFKNFIHSIRRSRSHFPQSHPAAACGSTNARATIKLPKPFWVRST